MLPIDLSSQTRCSTIQNLHQVGEWHSNYCAPNLFKHGQDFSFYQIRHSNELVLVKVSGGTEAKNQGTNTDKVADDGATKALLGIVGAHRKECKKPSISPSALEHLPEK